MNGAFRRLVLAFVLLLAPAWANAQRPDPLARALASYRDLDYDAAASALRAAIAATGAMALEDADRTRALMYLGATEAFRGRRDAAIEAFRTLLSSDVRYRPDELVFPPEVSTLFQEARTGVRLVSVRVPDVTEIRATTDRFAVRLYSASAHEVRASIIDASGGPVRVLHDGVVADSLELLWNGRDGLGRLREAGSYRLRVTSRSPAGREEREVVVPLAITRSEADTLASPAPLDPALLRTETVPGTGGARYLVTGLTAAVIAAALPSVAGEGSAGGTLRFGVALAIGGAGIYGFTRGKQPRPVTENIEYNRRQRATWQQEADRIARENEARRSAARLRIEAGRPVATVLP